MFFFFTSKIDAIEWSVYSVQSSGDVQDPDILLNSISLDNDRGRKHYFSVFLPSRWNLRVLVPGREELRLTEDSVFGFPVRGHDEKNSGDPLPLVPFLSLLKEFSGHFSQVSYTVKSFNI